MLSEKSFDSSHYYNPLLKRESFSINENEGENNQNEQQEKKNVNSNNIILEQKSSNLSESKKLN